MRSISIRLAACTGTAAIVLAACTGMPDTRITPPPGRAPLKALVVLIDKDLIASAFAAYKGSLPLGAKTANPQPFIDQFVAGCVAEAKAAGVAATAEVVSQRAIQAGAALPSVGNATLTLRATAYGTRKEATTGRDLGWSGDTAWEFILSERSAEHGYRKTWAAGIKNENLNPALCGNYETCGRALAGKLFAQMRKDGVVR